MKVVVVIGDGGAEVVRLPLRAELGAKHPILGSAGWLLGRRGFFPAASFEASVAAAFGDNAPRALDAVRWGASRAAWGSIGRRGAPHGAPPRGR